MNFNKRGVIALGLPLMLAILSISMSVVREDDSEVAKRLLERNSLEMSTVLLNNERQVIPLSDLSNRKIAAVHVGAVFQKEFSSMIENYAAINSFTLFNTNLQVSVDSLNQALKLFNTVIFQTSTSSLKDKQFLNLLTELQKTKTVVLVAFELPANLQLLEAVNFPIIWIPESSPAGASYAAQAIFGGVGIAAKLPQNISRIFKKGAGFTTSPIRLEYTLAEEVGIRTKNLERPIDRIVTEAIAKRATPGAVVMVVKDGKVIFNKAYGAHTYSGGRATSTQDIFDLASVTKIGATTIAAMRLYEQDKLKLDSSVGNYIPLARNTNKSNLTVRELLLHQAGLVPYIPFFESLKPGEYSRDSTIFHPLKVADNYYLRANYFEEVMWPRMLNSHLSTRGKYVYSDLSMYLLKDIIERLSSERLDKYVAQQFYQPLGMHTAGFNPRRRFPSSKIVPTEDDRYFRKTLLEGYVHDQGAAMAGGVSGHAGLFSTANDMAILFQMILNGGSYGGKQYFKPETIKLFTAKHSDVSRRGLGFDRWDPDRSNRYPSDMASSQSYGHTGYTGTCLWVDPQHNLIYIFLSNRVHPSVTNKLSSLRIRPRIHDVIYEAIKEGLD